MTPELLKALEPQQTSGQRMIPYPRRQYGLGVRLLLWILRIYVALAVPLVVYAFFRAAMH